MHRRWLAFIFVALASVSPLLVAQPAAPRLQAEPTMVDIGSIDRGVDACADFYRFACGSWTAAHPLPPDRQRFDRFTELQQRNEAVLRRILEAPGGPSIADGASRPTAGDGDLKKARDYYAACVNERAIEAAGLAPLTSELARIAAVARRDALPGLIAHLHEIAGETPPTGSTRRAGAYVLFSLAGRPRSDDSTTEMANISADGLGLPGRDYYLQADERMIERRRQYRNHVAQMLALAGARSGRAAAGADAVLSIETALAAPMLDAAARRDPNATHHQVTFEQLQRLTPAFNWTRYLAARRAPAVDLFNVSEPDVLAAVNQILFSRPLDDVKAYLTWHLLHSAASRLPAAFRDATFDYFGRTLTGQEQPTPRWRECIADTDQQLGDALGRAYVEEAFGAQARADTLRIVRAVKDALRRDIAAADWMGPDTRRAAYEKLDTVIDRIGYPDVWASYASLAVSNSAALANLQHALAFHNAARIARIGKPTDRGAWTMTPPTVNAYYNPAANTITFPAGILQPPFYRAGGDAALNYGGVGAVVGHELTHGFDDQGRKYDGQGNLRDWWTPADGRAYDERSSCLATQYGEYTVAGDTHVNGRLTLGENTADNGGLRLALMAYLAGPDAGAQAMVDGFTPEQRVFLGWAQQWCESTRPEAERLKALTNPHAAHPFRVNGVISNMPEFQKAFSCKADAPMVRANACRVW